MTRDRRANNQVRALNQAQGATTLREPKNASCLREDCGRRPGDGRCHKCAVGDATGGFGSRPILGAEPLAARGSEVRVGITEVQLGATKPAHLCLAARAPAQAARQHQGL